MNKAIKNNVIEIMITIIFIIGSYVIWDNLPIGKMASVAASYDKMNYVALNIENNYIYNTNNTRNLNDTVITVSNLSNTNRNYQLVLKVSKQINYKNLQIELDNTIYNLDELQKINDKNYNIFILDENTIVASHKTYDVILFGNTNNNYDILYEIIESEVV